MPPHYSRRQQRPITTVGDFCLAMGHRLLTLKELEDSIFARDKIRVVFRRENNEANFSTYPFDRALSKNTSLVSFHARIESFMPGIPYVVIDGRGKVIEQSDIALGVIRSTY